MQQMTLFINTTSTCSLSQSQVFAIHENYKLLASEPGMSHGLIAVIIIGSLAGALVLCCWVGSIIECIQRIYKCSCPCNRYLHHRRATQTHSGLSGLAVTTVIANQNADPSTVIVARTLPPSYSSVIVNQGPLIEMSSMNSDSNKTSPARQMVNASVQVDTIEHDSSKSIRWLWCHIDVFRMSFETAKCENPHTLFLAQNLPKRRS